MNWDHWRAQFPITDKLVHLNHAGVSPISLRVASATADFMRSALNLDRNLYQQWEARTEAIRTAYAGLIGAQAHEIAFVKNTSEAISLVAGGLDWRSGDNVIAVDGEYPANIYPWYGLNRRGVETRLVKPVRGRVLARDVEALIDSRTRVVSVSFVDWNSGARTDLRPLGELCHARNILFCVDGIQGVGAVPLDVEEAQIDCLAVGGHKWLLAPEGCGFLYVSRRVVDRLHSILLGWKSVTDSATYLPYHFDVRPDALKFEPGTPSHLASHALGAAVDLLLEVGVDTVNRRLIELNDRLAAGLRTLGAEIVSPWGEGERSGTVVFKLGDADRLSVRLNQQGFVVRMRGGGVRIAPHFYLNEKDIDRLLLAIRSV